MDIIIIVLIILGAIIIYFATRFLGKALGLIIKIMLLLIVLIAFLAIMVYKDTNDLKTGFLEYNNAFLLYENNNLYAAIILKPLKNATLSIDSFDYFTKEELDQGEEDLNNKNYSALIGDNYRLFMLKPVVLNKNYTIDLKVKLDQGDLINILMSPDPYKVLAGKMESSLRMDSALIKKGLMEFYGEEEKIKGYLFAALLANYFQQQKPGELVTNIKEGRIMVYPESISFKVMKYLPWVW